MALFTVHHASDALKINTVLTALIPGSERPRAALFLLHALGEDSESWLCADMEGWAAAKGVAVLLPTCHRGMYTDMALGYRYFTYVSKEIPALSARWFPGLEGRPCYALGVGIGGYGALKCALRAPQTFSGAAALEPVLDISVPCPGATAEEWADAFGSGDTSPENDLFLLSDTCRGGPRPRILVSCAEKKASGAAFAKRLCENGIPCRADLACAAPRGAWLQSAAEYLMGEGA